MAALVRGYMIKGNIGQSEQRKRWVLGVLAITAGGGWLLGGGASTLSGAIVLFALFWFGALGIFQAKEKT